MSIVVQIFLIIVGLVFSYFLMRHTQKIAEYTKEVAQCNKKLSGETQRLREITEASWYNKELVDYLSDKYYGLVEEWPSDFPSWTDFLGWTFPPAEKDRPRVFRMYCRRMLLEMLFPRVKPMGEEIITKLEEKGFSFKRKND